MNVPRTTLVCVDCQYPALAIRALQLSLRQCDYEAVKFFTDDPGPAASDPRIEVVRIPRIASSFDYSRFVLKDLLRHVETDFVQVVQWDGYVTKGASWTDEFLDYDYIGARWWFREEGLNVGNGGFSLRSRKLLEALQDSEIKVEDAEDNVICLVNRVRLESHGIRFAPGPVADRYSFEGTVPSGREFGFHRVFNLPHFHGEAELAEVMDAITDRDFSSPALVTLVEKLADMGRKPEALRYAKRLRAQQAGYAAISPQFRANLERVAMGLVPRTDPCPCGSGQSFKRCCGAISNWTST